MDKKILLLKKIKLQDINYTLDHKLQAQWKEDFKLLILLQMIHMIIKF